jgi:hypothetical protein
VSLYNPISGWVLSCSGYTYSGNVALELWQGLLQKTLLVIGDLAEGKNLLNTIRLSKMINR